MPDASPLAESLAPVELPPSIIAADAEVAPLRPLAVEARTAAALIGVSERTLFDLTDPRGPIVPVRVGIKRLFPVVELERWLREETERRRNRAKQKK